MNKKDDDFSHDVERLRNMVVASRKENAKAKYKMNFRQVFEQEAGYGKTEAIVSNLTSEDQEYLEYLGFSVEYTEDPNEWRVSWGAAK